MVRWRYNEMSQKQKALVVGNTTLSPANSEQNIGNKSLATKKAPRFDRPVSIVIHNRRSRLADHDGLWGKYVLDGLVDAGVLQDDRPEIVQRVVHEQTKIEKGEEEETVIEIWEA